MATRGRPTDYRPALCDRLLAYFDVEPSQEKSIPHYKQGELAWEDFREVANPIPTVTKFCKLIGISTPTFYSWVKTYPEFASAFTRAQEMRKDMMIVNGLKGLYNPTFTIFAMRNMTDWKDAPLVDQSQHTHFTVILTDGRTEPNVPSCDGHADAQAERGVHVTL